MYKGPKRYEISSCHVRYRCQCVELKKKVLEVYLPNCSFTRCLFGLPKTGDEKKSSCRDLPGSDQPSESSFQDARAVSRPILLSKMTLKTSETIFTPPGLGGAQCWQKPPPFDSFPTNSQEKVASSRLLWTAHPARIRHPGKYHRILPSDISFVQCKQLQTPIEAT